MLLSVYFWEGAHCKSSHVAFKGNDSRRCKYGVQMAGWPFLKDDVVLGAITEKVRLDGL